MENKPAPISRQTTEKENLKYVFKLSYDSTSTADNTIDAEILGRSLINMSELINESTKVINGEDTSARIEVQAHEPGSFVIEFVAWLDNGGMEVLRSLGILSPVSAVGIGSVFAAIKALKNRKQVSKTIKDGVAEIKFDDGETIIVTESVDKLISNYAVRNHLDHIVKKTADFEAGAKVKFLNEQDELVEVIQPDEIEYFKAPSRKLLQEETTIEETLNIVFTVVALESKTGWKVRLPNNVEVAVRINDEAFLERIKNRERQFIKGDMFEVKLNTVERRLDGKVTVTRSIEAVIRHRVDASKKVL
tara:strand:+ start:585 stop:1499 length:915 start_codon:yes stop_codon:yes gene_type:complete